MLPIIGRAWKFGSHIDTDSIFPGRYLKLTSTRDIASHAMEGLVPEFTARVNKGDIIVAGEQFGVGSSREQAVMCLKYAGIRAIVAESFGRIFYRNAINLALPVLICPHVTDSVDTGDFIEIDFDHARIINHTRNLELNAEPMPEFCKKIIDAGGLIPYLKSRKEL
jgi:3-isopropylmalate/(R)-2-methylmalate dehydratase small subunit